MNSIRLKKYNPGFSIVLTLFSFIYIGGLVFTLLAWLGVQSYDPQIWPSDTIPLYTLTFLVGAASVFGIWLGKKWGVYSLAGAWALTGVIHLVFVSRMSMPYWNIYLAMLLVITFFLFLLPVWQKME